MKKVKCRLEKLLKEGEKVKEDDIKAQSVWASETKILIDMFLGQGPHNMYSEAYYEFCDAESHSDKIAILKAILLSPKSTSESPSTTSQSLFKLKKLTFWQFNKPVLEYNNADIPLCFF